MTKTTKNILQYSIMGLCLAAVITIFILSIVKLLNFSNGTADEASIKLFKTLIGCTVAVLVFALIITLKTQFNLSSKGYVAPVLFVLTVLFIVIYPYFSLFSNTIARIVYDLIMGFVFASLSLSLFFAFNKNENEQMPTKLGYTICFVIISSLAICLVFEILGHWFNAIFDTTLYSSFDKFFVDVCFKILGSVITASGFAISLATRKLFCNYCLIYKETAKKKEKNKKEAQQKTK